MEKERERSKGEGQSEGNRNTIQLCSSCSKGTLGSKEEAIGSSVPCMQQREEKETLLWKELIWRAAL